jgi:site-specific DNA recombinase
VKVIIAARLSRLGKGQTGIDTQDQDAYAWAQYRNHQVVAVVADRISGVVSPFKRKNLGPWLTEPKKLEQYNGIVFAKIDRSGRARDWGFREWAEKHEKKLIIVSPELQWPPADPDDTVTAQMWDMLINQAIAEWKNTSQRYRRMQAALRQNNLLVGRPNYGYRAVPQGDHKILVRDPEMAPLIRKAAMQLYIEDDFSFADISEWFAEHGAMDINGHPLRPTTVGVLFRNPALYGRRVSRASGRIDLRIADPILTRDEWHRLQEKINKKAGRKGVASKTTAMLTSIVHCPKCQLPMYRHYSHAHQRGRAYYRCRGKETAPSTCGYMVPLIETNQAVNDIVMAYGHLEHKETVFIPGSNHASEIADIDDQLRDLVTDVDAPDFDDRLIALRAERKRLQSLPSETGHYEVRGTGQTVAEYWSSLDDLGKRRYLLDELQWKVYPRKDDDGDISVEIEGGEVWANMRALAGYDVYDEMVETVKGQVEAAMREAEAAGDVGGSQAFGTGRQAFGG